MYTAFYALTDSAMFHTSATFFDFLLQFHLKKIVLPPLCRHTATSLKGVVVGAVLVEYFVNKY